VNERKTEQTLHLKEAKKELKKRKRLERYCWKHKNKIIIKML